MIKKVAYRLRVSFEFREALMGLAEFLISPAEAVAFICQMPVLNKWVLKDLWLKVLLIIEKKVILQHKTEEL